MIAGLDAGDTSDLVGSIGWALLFTTLSGVLGLGIAMIVRNSTAAISGFLVWGFVLENLFRLFLAEEAARFLPFVAGNHLLAYANDLESPHALCHRAHPARERPGLRRATRPSPWRWAAS